MSEVNTNFNFGAVNDENDALQSKQGGKFGLNTNCHFSLIDFTDKAGSGGTEGNAVDVHILVGDREYRRRIFDPEGKTLPSYVNGSRVDLNPGDEGYEKRLNDELSQMSGMVTHAVKAAGVSQESLSKALTAAGVKTFAQFAQIAISLLPADYKKKDIDVFLQWQSKPSEGYETTFLDLPKNMKDKYWVVPSTPGVEWKEVKDANGLMYIDSNGNEHKIKKTASFFDKPYSKQQGSSDNTNHSGITGNSDTGNKKSEW